MTAVGLALTAGGCDRGWTVYQQVQLGQPLPAESPLRPAEQDANAAEPSTRPEKKLECYTWADSGVWPLPLSFGWHVVAARMDSQGRVIVKTYAAHVLSNYVLLRVPAVRQVVELEVPAGIPMDQQPPVDGMPKVTGGAAPVDEGPETISTLREYLTVFMLASDEDLLAYREDSPGPLLQVALGTNYELALSTYIAFYYLQKSVEKLPLDGIDKDGYDRTFRPVAGGSIRLQNLGGRRIRMEANLLHFYDPFRLTAYLYWDGQ
jgi:hypothetical protein